MTFQHLLSAAVTHRTAPHRTAPHRTAPHRTAPAIVMPGSGGPISQTKQFAPPRDWLRRNTS